MKQTERLYTDPDASGAGCPVCDWRGHVAEMHTREERRYTHLIIRDAEVFRGPTCTRELKDRERLERVGLLRRLIRALL